MKTIEEKREYKRKQMAAWRAAHREQNRETDRQGSKRRRDAKPKQEKAKIARWYAKHQEREQRKAKERRAATDPEVKKARAKAYYAAHREQWLAYGRRRYIEQKETMYFHGIKARYGITKEALEALGTACMICGVEKSNGKSKRLEVDHCHKSNVVRGLLCHCCNIGIANFKDDPARLIKASEYLTKR